MESNKKWWILLVKIENVEIPENYKTNKKRIIIGAILLYLALPVIFMLDLVCIFGNNIIFRIAGIPRLDRKKYIRPFSRFKLPGHSIWYKLGCVYCSYANGVAYYYKDTAMSIEFLYCPWKQKQRTRISHHNFFNDW